MSNEFDGNHKFRREEAGEQSPPGRRGPIWPEGQDYFSLLEKHGRPHGPFERERVHLYKAVR